MADWEATVMVITSDNIGKYCHTERYEVGGIDNPITVGEDAWDIKKLLNDQAEITWDRAFKAGQQAEEEKCEKVWEEMLMSEREAIVKAKEEGRENEKAKIKAIYNKADNLKELEDLIKEYLNTTT